jgi:hypothetical protein
MKTTSKPTGRGKGKANTPPKPRKLTVRQEKFCELIAAGKSGTDAWLEAGYEVSREVARRNASESLTNPVVEARIAELRKPQTQKALRKKEDNLRFLADVIGTAIEEITAASPLCVEYTEEIIGGGNRGKLKRGNAPSGNETIGESILRRRVKKPCPLRAIEIYSKLLGHYEPDRVEVEAGPKTLQTIKERANQVASALGRRWEAKA